MNVASTHSGGGAIVLDRLARRLTLRWTLKTLAAYVAAAAAATLLFFLGATLMVYPVAIWSVAAVVVTLAVIPLAILFVTRFFGNVEISFYMKLTREEKSGISVTYRQFKKYDLPSHADRSQ